MKSAQIKVAYIDHMGNDLTTVNAARISFKGESQTLSEKDEKLIDYLAKNEHMSPFEHCVMTVMIECPLYIRSQIHRHRTFAYNKVSRRYTSDDLEFYIPPATDIRAQSKNNKQASEGAIDAADLPYATRLMESVCETALYRFEELIKLGVSREQARGILPQCLMTKFYMTGNLRNWAHFIRLRDDGHAQKEVQYIAKEIKTLMLDKFPVASAALFKYNKKT